MSKTAATPDSRLLMVLQLVCASSAVASLPAGMIHPLWLATFIVPAIVFLVLGADKLQFYVPTWARFAVAAAVQGIAAFITFSLIADPHPLDQRSGLACSLLPFLTYFTLRREPSDTSLSLFLSFCFLLIGIMLNQDKADWTLLAFLVTCPWAMQIEASNRSLQLRHAARGRSMSLGTLLLRRAQVVVALMLVAMVAYFAIDLIPSPSQGTNRKRTGPIHDHRSVGLNNRFDLSGAEGSPLNLTAEDVLRVRDPQDESVPSDLYLRMTHFDRPGVHEWHTWPFNRTTRDIHNGFWCRERIRVDRGSLPIHKLDVARLTPPTEGEMFLPPGTLQISGISRLEFDNFVAHYRTKDPNDQGYQLLYQRPHKHGARGPIDTSLGSLLDRMAEVPKALKTPELVSLSAEFAGTVSESRPIRLAHRLAGRLQQLCTYELKDPIGRYDDAVHNFLFGNHRGYCMHFATSLALMLRLRGVPCRIGVGFHAGDPNPDGSRTFGSRHAHAWVELPIAGYGWVIVDPTPAADRARRGWPDPALLTSKDVAGPDADAAGASGCFLTSALPFLEEPLKVLSDPLHHPGAFLMLIGVFVLISVSLVLLVLRRARGRAGGRQRNRRSPDTVRARALLDRILTGLARRGHPKHHRATLEQFVEVLDTRHVGIDLARVIDAFDAYQQVRFGSKPLDGAREECMLAGLATVRELKE